MMSRKASFLALLFAALVLLFAILLYNVSSIITDNKPFVEQTLAEKLQARVAIGHLGMHWGLEGAVFVLDDVKITSTQPMLHDLSLERVDMGLDLFSSLFALTPQISSLDLHGIALHVAASSTTFLATLRKSTESLGGSGQQDSNFLAFLSSLRRFAISDATLFLQSDDGTQLAPLDLSFQAHRIFGTVDLLGKICPQGTNRACYLVAKGSVTSHSSGDLEGEMALSGDDLLVPLTPLFPESWHANHLFAHILFKRVQGLCDLKVSDIQYSDPDLDLRGEVALVQEAPPRGGRLDLDLKLPRANAAKAGRYIPADILPGSLIRWLHSAITDGTIVDGAIRIKGELQDIPLHDGTNNLFAIRLGLKQGRLKFDPAWPEVGAVIEISPKSLAISVSEGRSQGVDIAKGQVTLADFADPTKRLLLDLHLGASSNEAQSYFNNSPLAASLGAVAPKLAMKQNRFILHLELPLGLDLATAMSGTVQLDGTELAYRGTDLGLTDIRGKINFSHDAIDARGIKAVFLGMPIAFDLADESFAQQKPIFVKLKGDCSTLALGSAFAPWALKLIDGTTPFTANLVLTLGKGGLTTNLDMRASMEGVAIHIPQIYDKESRAAAPLRLLATIDGEKRATINAVLADTLVLNCSSQADFDFLSRPTGSFYRKPSPAAKTALTGFLIDTPRIKGTISRAAGKGGKLLLDFTHIAIDTPPKETVADQEDPGDNGSFTPFGETQVTILDLCYHDLHLQHLSGGVTGSAHGISLHPLAFTLDDSRFNFDKAVYEKGAAGMTTALEGSLDTKSLGSLLKSQDIFADLRGLAGKVRFALHWPKSPWSYDRRTLAGMLDIDLADGKLKNSNSILNRIINLLTLNLQQTLGSDLEIKNVKGRLDLANALISTDGFIIDLTGARTEAHGKVNLVDETIDSKVAMSIDISRLIKIGIAFVINPVVGGLYWWKGNPASIPLIDNLTRHSYTIKGPWQKPEVTMLPLIKL